MTKEPAKQPATPKAPKAKKAEPNKDKSASTNRPNNRPEKMTKAKLAKPLVVQLEHAFHFFNGYLFRSKLPTVVFVTEKSRTAYGHFWAKQWLNGDHEFHEISINPEKMKGRTLKDTLGTLVHEMVHLQHFEEDPTPRNGYHTKRWATLMDEVGLTPSTTGKPGGKRTGQKCSHYIVDGGPFDKAADQLIKDGFTLDWFAKPVSAEEKAVAKQKRDSKTKYTCPCCQANAWGKPGLNIECGEDGVPFEVDGGED